MAAGSVFIGRAAELGRLFAALDRAGHGQPAPSWSSRWLRR
jgi:hypothetical protein